MAEDLGYYLRLFVLNKRILVLIGIPLFALFITILSVYGETDEYYVKGGEAMAYSALLECVSVLFIFFAATSAHRIEKPDKNIFWWMYLSLSLGTMVFMIPALAIAQVTINMLPEIPFVILVILSAIPPQIPVVLRYRKYLRLTDKTWYVPDPGGAALVYSLLPGTSIAVAILALRGLGLDGMRWIPISYFSTLLILFLILSLSLFFSYHKTMDVLEKDEEKIPMIRIR